MIGKKTKQPNHRHYWGGVDIEKILSLNEGPKIIYCRRFYLHRDRGQTSYSYQSSHLTCWKHCFIKNSTCRLGSPLSRYRCGLPEEGERTYGGGSDARFGLMKRFIFMWCLILLVYSWSNVTKFNFNSRVLLTKQGIVEIKPNQTMSPKRAMWTK
jgi:hypothetical protein